jgi:hypothetical protein
MKFAIDHEPDKAVPAGGTFFEPRGALHTSFGSANPDAPVRIVAFLVVPNGSPLSERAAARREPQSPPGPPMPYVAVHQPEFVTAAEATFLQDDDILLGVTSGSVAKAYPAGDLSKHTPWSATPDGPISVTWCGVCNTGLVFRAEAKGRTLHFQYDRMVGANEVQKDAETGSSWQQATGEAIDGPLKGARLTLFPVVRTTWGEWRRRYPRTLVLKPLPGYAELLPSRSRRIRTSRAPDPDGAPKGALALDTRLPARDTVAGLEVGGDSGVPVRRCGRACRQRPRGRVGDRHRPSAVVGHDHGVRRAGEGQDADVSGNECRRQRGDGSRNAFDVERTDYASTDR